MILGILVSGKLHATADHATGVLRVHAIHRDVPFTKTVTRAVTGEIKDMARWLERDLSLPG